MSEVKIYPKEGKNNGYVHNGRGLKENFKKFFIIQFDKPIRDYGRGKIQPISLAR